MADPGSLLLIFEKGNRPFLQHLTPPPFSGQNVWSHCILIFTSPTVLLTSQFLGNASWFQRTITFHISKPVTLMEPLFSNCSGDVAEHVTIQRMHILPLTKMYNYPIPVHLCAHVAWWNKLFVATVQDIFLIPWIYTNDSRKYSE